MGDEGVTEKKLQLAKRTKEQLQEIVRRKQSLSLDLKCALPASSDDDRSLNCCIGTASSCDSNLFQETNNRKIASGLLPQSIPSSDTVETFHTAAADSPELCIAFEDTKMQMSDIVKNETANFEEREESCEQNDHLTHDDTNSSEVESKNIMNVNNKTMESTSDEEKKPLTVSDISENMLQDSLESPIQQNPAMKRLNQRIARQRMMVMRCLDAGTSSKEDLNRQIMILQDLQRRQIELEVSLLENERKNHSTRQLQCDDSGVNGDSDDDGGDNRLVINEDYVQNEPSAYCSVVEPTNNSSAILLTVAQTRSQLFRNNRPNTNTDQETLSESLAPKRSSSRGYSTVYLTVSYLSLSLISLSFR